MNLVLVHSCETQDKSNHTMCYHEFLCVKRNIEKVKINRAWKKQFLTSDRTSTAVLCKSKGNRQGQEIVSVAAHF